jgi:DNA helicase II / ATP-dependent DNA helicase PcrA
MALHPEVVARLERLAPDQREAATAPPGPILCVAPAGSGKTTTLVARVAWLISSGVDPGAIAAITFNRRAADELTARLSEALLPLELDAGAVRVRTFHALGREILREAGHRVDPIVDRTALLRRLAPGAGRAGWGRLDTLLSRLKLEYGLRADDIVVDEAGPAALFLAEYEHAVAATGGLDFDDLVARALRLLTSNGDALAAWRRRCGHLLVDEVQDVDRSQLRLALLLAAPENRIFLVGDDDQSIYGWRLADVRRVLDLDASLPGLRRIDLVTNYRCPGPVVERAVRLVEGNRERFSKRIVARPEAVGQLVLAPDGRDDVVRLGSVVAAFGPEDGSTRAVLARTNRELLPAAAAALALDVPFRAERLTLLVESPIVDDLLARVTGPGPLLIELGALVRAERAAEHTVAAHEPDGAPDDPDDPSADRLVVARALLGWAAGYRDLETLRAAIAKTRLRLAALRRDDAALTLATAHGTKGLEFDHVAVIGLEEGRFPSARSIADATEPGRALEEERRLAYVAWTRARRSLTLVYDPATPSRFLLEAFTPAELGLSPDAVPPAAVA